MTLVPGEKLVLELENDQRWAVYSFCDGPLTLRWNTFTKALVASERCTGSLRLARLGAEVDELDSYASCSVLGGKLFAQDSFSYGWTFDTKGDCQQGPSGGGGGSDATTTGKLSFTVNDASQSRLFESNAPVFRHIRDHRNIDA